MAPEVVPGYSCGLTGSAEVSVSESLLGGRTGFRCYALPARWWGGFHHVHSRICRCECTIFVYWISLRWRDEGRLNGEYLVAHQEVRFKAGPVSGPRLSSKCSGGAILPQSGESCSWRRYLYRFIPTGCRIRAVIQQIMPAMSEGLRTRISPHCRNRAMQGE
jgi:hypothetical protein